MASGSSACAVAFSAKRLNLTTTAITNVENSSIDREADYSIFTHVGPEVGVASTKSFTSQLIVLLSISKLNPLISFSIIENLLSSSNFSSLINEVPNVKSL